MWTSTLNNRKENAYKYNVAELEDIFNIIIPHFDKYPLLTSKNLDYLDFKKVAYILRNKLDLDEIISIKNNMNSKRPYAERWTFYDNKGKIVLNNEWLQAFIDGEGSFQFNISKTVNRNKSYTAYIPTLSISQSSHSVKILKAIIDFFAIGYLKPKYDITSMETAKLTKVNRCIFNQTAVIIKFRDKHLMYTRKQLDCLAWKKLIKLKKDKQYNKPKGRLLLEKIKASMNSGRNEE